MPELVVEFSWVSTAFQELAGLNVRRGRANLLRFDDGIELAVKIVDPSGFTKLDDLEQAVKRESRPGQLVLVAGSVPLSWRSRLREGEISFVDASGVAEIAWPRVRISTTQFARSPIRKRTPLPLQKGYGLVAQLLVDAEFVERRLTLGTLAETTGMTASTISRAVTQLAAQGLAEKTRSGRNVLVRLTDPVAVAERLAERTAWTDDGTVSGYLWRRNVWEIASSLSDNARKWGLDLAVTGRAALPFFGVLATSSPRQVRCWVRNQDEDAQTGSELEHFAISLGLESTSIDEANVILAHDRWKMGTHASSTMSFEGINAAIAHPLRVWCDLHDEQRGSEFAAQLWKTVTHGR